MPAETPDPARPYRIDLHRHLDGSMPVELMYRLLQEGDVRPIPTLEEFRAMVVAPARPASLLEYLDRFHYPLWVTQFYENIVEVTRAVVAQAAAEGAAALELRYAPTLHLFAGLTLRQSVRAVLDGLNRGQRETGVRCGLILIAMRQQGPHIAKIVARQAIADAQQYHEGVGVVGFDIAGPELGFPPRLFREAYRLAARAGLGLTAHAGESGGPEHIWQAIDELGVQRIGHGYAAARDPELVRRLARDRICLEICYTSSVQTGSADPVAHPVLRFLDAGIPIAICCDNTTVSNTSLPVEETRLARIGLPPEAFPALYRAARSRYTFIRDGGASGDGGS
ncbi:MAG TPA: adenosine deaminase [Thermodesulfobacteriota bacterium]|nr:adenosine deaminase [Thermodesulfobacteriota bacterium]